MERLEKMVGDLYNFRDRFFDTHTVQDASKKNELVKEKLEEVIKEFEKADKSLKATAKYKMLYGKALNIGCSRKQFAEEMLCKAVKLDPSLTDAWTSLGECYWKKGDIDSARNCFLSAVSHKKDKVSLRNLSMITRCLGSTPEDKCRNVSCSFDMAKEAVEMDPNDGLSWLTLGNAYVAKYFSTRQSPELMKNALSAFANAEKDHAAANNYDLHFNKGNVNEYLENYGEALNSYAKAHTLDPTFKDATKKENELFQYLQKFSALVNTCGGLKKKRLKLLLKMIDHRKDVMFHPQSEELKIKSLQELSEGRNLDALYVGRVVGSLNMEDPVCLTFALIDKSKGCVGVTLYNASQNWGVNIGDSILIAKPNLRHQNFSSKDRTFKFSNIRVESPLLMMVNGKVPPCEVVAPTVMTQMMKTE